MAELLRGTVTFLFTDIEGSTGLLKRLGDGYAEVLDEHWRILREAVAAHDGREVDNQGDAFFFAFPRAKAALAAAVAAQRALAEHAWPEGGEVRVRMGLHTGEPLVGEDRYVGLGVHRAARVGAVAHGGQVLLSTATRELVEDEAEGASVRELGSYRLKDIDRPERLFQLDIDGLQTAFAPLKAEKISQPNPLGRRAVAAGALAGVIAAAVAIPILAFGQGGGEASLGSASGNSVGIVDSSSRKLLADVKVGATPTRVAVGWHSYWVTNQDERTVSRVDAAAKASVPITVGNGPTGVAVGNNAVWVTNSLDGTVSRVDPTHNKLVQTIRVGNGPVGIVYGARSLWVANSGDGTITRIDAVTGKAAKPLRVAATELAFGDGVLWASQPDANRVVRIDPSTGKVVQPVTVGNGPTGIAYGADSVWVANSLDGTISRIDPARNAIAATIPVGNGPNSVAVDRHGVWVSNQFGGTLVRIDPHTNQASRPTNVGNRPQGVATVGGNVLVAIRQSGSHHHGGRLVLRSWLPAQTTPIDSIDPAVAYSVTSWPLIRMTGDGLVGFNQVSGLAGTRLVPDLAVSLPAPADGGKTYTFRLREDIRYSDGRPVKPSDFRATFERDFSVGSPILYYDGIVGAARCKERPKKCDLSAGIVADDSAGTVTFRLVAPDPEFLYKLAVPFAYVLPADMPRKRIGTRPLPATGPYAIAKYEPKHVMRLVRNRYFHEWSRAAQPNGYANEIVLRIGGTSVQAIRDVLAGRADVLWASEPLSQHQVADLFIQHAGLVHESPGIATQGLFLNTHVPPFDHVDVRRAVNYAINRANVVRANGGPHASQPTCQILPPNFPGYQSYCPYTAGANKGGRWTGPDLARARDLVARSGTRGMKVTFWAWTLAPGFNRVAVKTLRALAYRVSTKVLGNDYFGAVSDSRNKAQIGFTGWQPDYPAASNFFRYIFTCKSFIARTQHNNNSAAFCDPELDRLIERATRVQPVNPAAAKDLWARIDREVVDQAPWVPLTTPKIVDLLSKRAGNYQYSPGFGMLVDQLWVR